MGICLECVYKGDKVEDHRRNPHLRKEDFNCLNVKNSMIDFITGISKPGTCRMCNGIGECLYFDDGSIPLYAWSNSDKTVYTLQENIDITDSYRNVKNEIIGKITDIGETTFFAYRSKEKNYYILAEEVGEAVFLDDRTKIGEVSEIGEESIKITVDEITFEIVRNKKSDIIYEYIIADEVKLFRAEWEDISFTNEESNESEDSGASEQSATDTLETPDEP